MNWFFVYPPGFPLANEVNALYQRAFETGIICSRRLFEFKISAEDNYSLKPPSHFGIFDLSEILDPLGLWLLLGVGCGLGSLTLLGEIVHSRLMKRRKNSAVAVRSSRKENMPARRDLIGTDRAWWTKCHKRGSILATEHSGKNRPNKKMKIKRIVVAEKFRNDEEPRDLDQEVIRTFFISP